MPVVAEEAQEQQESVDDDESASVTIDDSQSDATFTTSNKQESTYTRDNQSEVSHSISSKHESIKQGKEPEMKSRIASYSAKGALSAAGNKVVLHLYEKQSTYNKDEIPNQFHVYDFFLNQKGFEIIEKVNDK